MVSIACEEWGPALIRKCRGADRPPQGEIVFAIQLWLTTVHPDFMAFAASFGIQAYLPHNVAELREALVESIGSQRLRLIEVKSIPASTGN
jgi:2-succinyl-5-enolpyruvyl-6-hydroxy-3-cyclohexene-1-carboxylate synthase